MKRRKVFSSVEHSARQLAAELVLEVAEELNISAAHLKSAGHQRGGRDGQQQLNMGEAMACAEMKLRQKACDVGGQWQGGKAEGRP